MTEILLDPPPELPNSTNPMLGQALLYLPMLAGGAAMSLMWVGPGTGSPITYLASGMYGLSTVGMLAASMGQGMGDRRRRIDAERRDYLRQLAQHRRTVAKAASAQRAALRWAFPEPDGLWSVALSRRLWERGPGDADFGHVRVARGTQQLAARLVPPETKPAEDLEPLCAAALFRFLRGHAVVPDLPVALSLRAFPRLRVDGDRAQAHDLVRAMIAHLATFHAPDDVRVAVCASESRLRAWEWLKWLPHATHPTRTDAVGPLPLFATDLGELERAFAVDLDSRPHHNGGDAALPDRPHLVVVVDGGTVSPGQLATGSVCGVTLLDLSGTLPDRRDLPVLRLTGGQATLVLRGSTTPLGVPDRLGEVPAVALANQLAPLRLAQDGAQQDVGTFTLAGLLGVGDPGRIDPAVTWQPRPHRDRLRVPIGAAGNGPLELDLKEAAQGGMGPHGMVIGATGSGKSELLRTLVLGLAVTHSSADLNVVLVDFKGGATFLGLDRLPHTSAVITNLAEELPLVDRMQDALHGELIRRQDLLRRSGHASRRDYDRARDLDAPLPPLPTLLVIVDEFSELLANKPDLAELFVMIGRLGRSLGVHLLLASQHYDEGRMRGLGVHLSFRVALRTFSAAESRAVIGESSAHELPSAPGHAYLMHDNTRLIRFRAAYVSGPYRRPTEPAGGAPPARRRQVLDYQLRPLSLPDAAAPAPPDSTVPAPPDTTTPAPPPVPSTDELCTSGTSALGSEHSVLDVMVNRLAGHGPPAHHVWLPPLDESPTLDTLLPGPPTPETWPTPLRVPVGIIDRPFEQRRDPLIVELDGGSGHVAVVGKPQSGKSTAVRTLLAALALSHTPDQVQFYCLDFGGGSLRSLAGLPHTGGVATRREPELVRRTLSELLAALERREAEFAARGVTGMKDARQLPDRPFPDLFLVIDGWQVLQREFESLDPIVGTLAARGLSYGIHVTLSANRWMDVRPSLRDLLGTRLELRLGEPFESEVNRKAAANVPENSAGRGITLDALHFLTAQPRIDGGLGGDLNAGATALVATVRGRWSGPVAPPVRTLPRQLPARNLPAATVDALPIGLDEESLSPVALGFDAEPHLIILGEPESGRTNLLRLICQGLVTAFTSQEARLVVADYRRTLLDVVPDSHLIEYAASAEALGPIAADIAQAMRRRLPGPDVTTKELRTRSWWQGSRLFLLIDDYDLIDSAQSNPLNPLVDLIGHGADIGLHLVVARATGGSARALYETVLRQIREQGNPALMLSGNPDEGPLFGHLRPQPLPPGRGVLVSRRNGTRTIQTAWTGP
ncbi:type VII secretion protein EccCa [Micromonosporaceae bacterium B7E4]